MGRYDDWIGRSESIDDVATELVASRMSGLLDSDATPKRGDPWPAAWTWALFWHPLRHADAGPDGHAAGGFMPPIDLPRRMWAGSTVTVDRPILVGDAVRRTSTIADISEKTGRSGALVFVTVEHEIRGGSGHIRESQRFAYRAAAGGPALSAARAGAPGPGPDFAPQFRRTVAPDPVLLFQYSAVTYNTHRIHYDHPYATLVEGYPGLVVHGPLTATLLMDLLSRRAPQRAVASFTVTATRPLFAVAPFEIVGAIEGDTFRLAALDGSNEIAMRLEGAFS